MKQTSTRLSVFGLSSLLAAGIVMILFSVKYRVQDLEGELADLNQAIIADRQAIHVLNAEWSLLNNPRRLKDLAVRHLGLQPVTPNQLKTFSMLPMVWQQTAGARAPALAALSTSQGTGLSGRVGP